jgi:hypothetical protein
LWLVLKEQQLAKKKTGENRNDKMLYKQPTREIKKKGREENKKTKEE